MRSFPGPDAADGRFASAADQGLDKVQPMRSFPGPDYGFGVLARWFLIDESRLPVRLVELLDPRDAYRP